MKREHNVVRAPVRAIDVGYFNTKISLGRKALGDSSVIKTVMKPSLAPMNPVRSMNTSGSGSLRPRG